MRAAVALILPALCSAAIYPSWSGDVQIAEDGEYPWNATVYESALNPFAALENIVVNTSYFNSQTIRNCSGSVSTEAITYFNGSANECKSEINSVVACAVLQSLLDLYETSTSAGACRALTRSGNKYVTSEDNVSISFCVDSSGLWTVPLSMSVSVVNYSLDMSWWTYTSGAPDSSKFAIPSYCPPPVPAAPSPTVESAEAARPDVRVAVEAVRGRAAAAVRPRLSHWVEKVRGWVSSIRR